MRILNAKVFKSKKRRLPISESPHDNISKGHVSTKSAGTQKPRGITNQHIIVKLDQNKVKCTICETSQDLPQATIREYLTIIKPVVDLFKENHKHQ